MSTAQTTLLIIMITATIIIVLKYTQPIAPKIIISPPELKNPKPQIPQLPEIDLNIDPKPNTIAPLREYKINKNGDIWISQEPESYIIPENEWVKYFASRLYIDENGIVRYKDRSNLYENYPFVNKYNSDNSDNWQNPDYYLSEELVGDCEDFALALTSMMLSGNISVKNENIYVREIIPAKIVFGYMGQNKIRHAWVEYQFEGITYIADSPGTDLLGNSLTYYRKKSELPNYTPLYEFTNNYFKKVT